MWVTYLRDEYLHLANTTNNRLECHHHKLKDLISQSCVLSEMFNHVLTFSSTHALEYSQKSFVEEFTSRTTKFDEIPEAVEVAAVCTEHAANLICEQLVVANKVEYKITKVVQTSNFELTYKDHKHCVNVDLNCCSCSFQKTLGLPCCHLFAVRAHLGLAVFDKIMVQERWLISYQIHLPHTFATTCNPPASSGTLSSDVNYKVPKITKLMQKPLKGTLSQNQKYKKTMKLGQKIAGPACQVGMRDFHEIFHCFRLSMTTGSRMYRF